MYLNSHHVLTAVFRKRPSAKNRESGSASGKKLGRPKKGGKVGGKRRGKSECLAIEVDAPQVCGTEGNKSAGNWTDPRREER